jgi:hypothetical protein
MIRDPSDGSVKRPQTLQEKYGSNWGLTSLDEKPKANAFKAPTAEELAAHYATHNLGFQPKEDQSCKG